MNEDVWEARADAEHAEYHHEKEMEEAILKERERCAKAMCYHCEREQVATQDSRGFWVHEYPAVPMKPAKTVGCLAAGIRRTQNE